MQEKIVDVVIVGAGPAGAACALQLGGAGVSVTILEKSVFPRDKTCGDALSVDVVNQLDLLSPQLAEAFTNFPEKSHPLVSALLLQISNTLISHSFTRVKKKVVSYARDLILIICS